MTHETFNALLAARVEKIRAVLARKCEEYATSDDRLHNFKKSAELGGDRESPAEVCLGFMLKHLTSICDLVALEKRGATVTVERWDEKIGDAINYLILLEALVKE